METKIFKNHLDYLCKRKNKEMNGVSKEFAKSHKNYKKDNSTNTGCWNCRNSMHCISCVECTGCLNVSLAFYLKGKTKPALKQRDQSDRVSNKTYPFHRSYS